MADADEALLRELLLDVYRQVAPEHSEMGDILIRKLAAGLYERGGRIIIGGNRPPKYETIHVSVDKADRIVWTCAKWHGALGLQPHSAIGKSIYDYLSPSSAAFRREYGLPLLLREKRIGPVPVTFRVRGGGMLAGSLTSEILCDSEGNFRRTFSRIRIPVMMGLLLAAVASR